MQGYRAGTRGKTPKGQLPGGGPSVDHPVSQNGGGTFFQWKSLCEGNSQKKGAHSGIIRGASGGFKGNTMYAERRRESWGPPSETGSLGPGDQSLYKNGHFPLGQSAFDQFNFYVGFRFKGVGGTLFGGYAV